MATKTNKMNKNQSHRLLLPAFLTVALLALTGCMSQADDSSQTGGSQQTGDSAQVNDSHQSDDSAFFETDNDDAPPSASTPTQDSILLSWTPPTRKLNGEPINLGEIQNYEIHYGTSPGTYTHKTTILYPEDQAAFYDLEPGTYYFAVKASITGPDNTSLNSPFSEELVTTIN